MMSQIRGKDTKPELVVRRYLHKNGLRFRLHVKELPGKPDIVLKRYKTVIFVNGCFWHRHENCKYSYMPKSNNEFWEKKFGDTIARDMKNYFTLQKAGWDVKIVWECEVNSTDYLNGFLNEILGRIV